MEDLGLNLAHLATGLQWETTPTHHRIAVSDSTAAQWPQLLALGIRRCYVSDDELKAQCGKLGVEPIAHIRYWLPDPGSVMAGDFGELLTLIVHAAHLHPTPVYAPKKWALKQDRTKPAPYLDVIQFVLPQWPQASIDDAILISEVKTKSTNGGSTPIQSSIADFDTDPVSRKARTLTWLAERAYVGEPVGVALAKIERFSNATSFPRSTERRYAVAVVCESLVDAELATISAPPVGCELLVISVPELRELYMNVYAATNAAAPEP